MQKREKIGLQLMQIAEKRVNHQLIFQRVDKMFTQHLKTSSIKSLKIKREEAFGLLMNFRANESILTRVVRISKRCILALPL